MIESGVLIDCGSSKVDELISISKSLGVTMSKVRLDEAKTTEFRPAQAMIISGGPHLFTGPEGELLWARFHFLTAVSMPVLGICLGHQALSMASGGAVYRGKENRSDVEIELLNPEHALFVGIPNFTKFGEDHCEGVTLPKGYSALASSRSYENEAMANDAQKRYGVQFHPEISGEMGRRLIQNFFSLAAER
ncbi:MAG: gamma-glutamyl-gamma-aminobutyrate hydrolase family protein [Verrucomicrobiota bacterium]